MLRAYGRTSVTAMFTVLILLFMLLVVSSCGGDSENKDTDSQTQNTNTSGLSDFELNHGIGPIKKELKLGPINPELATKGEEIFVTKCATCHKLDEKYTGPAQRNVLQRVTPEFFINMVLNPDENILKHPHAQEMLIKYNMQKMTNQNITIKDALALLEYFRVLDEELKQSKTN